MFPDYPYTNDHQLNLDWILRTLQQIGDGSYSAYQDVTDSIMLNSAFIDLDAITVKYASIKSGWCNVALSLKTLSVTQFASIGFGFPVPEVPEGQYLNAPGMLLPLADLGKPSKPIVAIMDTNGELQLAGAGGPESLGDRIDFYFSYPCVMPDN